VVSGKRVVYDSSVLKLPYRKLQIWQKSFELARETYLFTKHFPEEERFGLASQMKRSAVSVVSNIAEGSQRISDRDFRSFIAIARGSLAELETQALLADAIGYITKEDAQKYFTHIEEVAKMLRAFFANLSATANRSS